MAQDVFMDLARGIDLSIIALALQLFLAAIVALWFKKLIDMIVGSITFRLNRYVSIGCEVEVEGLHGIIQSVTWTSIKVVGENEFLVIPTSRWMWLTWKFKRRAV